MDNTLLENMKDDSIIKSPFDETIFDGISFGDLIKQSINSIDKAESEAYDLYNKIKKKTTNGNAEELMVFGQQAKEFLELITKQNESRAKIIQAATNIIKTTTNNINAINISKQSAEDNQQNNVGSFFEKFAKENDPLKSNVNVIEDRNYNDEMKQIEDKISNRLNEEEDNIEVIYPPKYYLDKNSS